jgi:acetyl esterase
MAGAARELADPELAAFLDAFNARPSPAPDSVGPAAMRAGAAERAAARPKGPEMDAVVELTVPPGGRPARLYRPTPSSAALVLYLHGGGWVIGDLATHDRACRRLAARSGVSVLALDYRLAPEHPWPAAIDDAVAALRWIAGGAAVLGGTPSAVAVAGDSAGGTTATLACLRLRDESPEAMPGAQLLVYANTDLTNPGESMVEKGHGFGLDAEDIEWFAAQWVPDPAMLADPRVSPLRAPDLSGLPETVVVTCEHDPLRDQGEAYADDAAPGGGDGPQLPPLGHGVAGLRGGGRPGRRRPRPQKRQRVAPPGSTVRTAVAAVGVMQ